MRLIRGLSFLAALAASCSLFGQTKNDEEAVRDLPHAFCDAWAKHDGHDLARIMAPDVDFVTVGATWLHGQTDFEKYHSRLLSGRFKEASNTLIKTEVRFLRPDLALVHWSWTIEGDKNFDGTPRSKRYGMMLMVAEKRDGHWLVVAAQNTNHLPGTPPEMQGINSPIVFPDTKDQPQGEIQTRQACDGSFPIRSRLKHSYEHAIREFIEWCCSEPSLALQQDCKNHNR